MIPALSPASKLTVVFIINFICDISAGLMLPEFAFETYLPRIPAI
jgi:hypothetical protein